MSSDQTAEWKQQQILSKTTLNNAFLWFWSKCKLHSNIAQFQQGKDFELETYSELIKKERYGVYIYNW